MESFRYRVNNVYENITKKQLENYKLVDFKKKMLKSPDLKEYYEKNINEKQLIIESIQKLQHQIKKNEVRCDGECPEYLLPLFLKDKISMAQEKIKKILVYQPENSNLQKKVRLNKYVYINESKENDGETDPSRLKIISRRKQWKLRHGFKLRKINKRLEKKGIFQS
ncbi:hypothetical protein IMG5_168840 [Ichthyophthirius multifiliis]|uniref:Uncharacterized protein n=1 Tax=Ichthyophthirius multifiliis TaxID=5932 RepID=G0R172_ICHMU|nr:hypothetical protein IMG5_168840 [Ichthyophthirius multifiliis]EGR28780.1 hypothetical protein IMG5_168840 [Ichthyophthirius multifiliis]|eukprot:XP_004030016.1 hypothetical protein IMG5_168840 [Ichthyophthirius multifiliis]